MAYAHASARAHGESQGRVLEVAATKKKKKDTGKAELNVSASANDLTEEQQRLGMAMMCFFLCVFARVHKKRRSNGDDLQRFPPELQMWLFLSRRCNALLHLIYILLL